MCRYPSRSVKHALDYCGCIVCSMAARIGNGVYAGRIHSYTFGARRNHDTCQCDSRPTGTVANCAYSRRDQRIGNGYSVATIFSQTKLS